jgi:hypothetical protein
MNAISQLEEWSRTGNGACLDYIPTKRVPGTPDHAPKWTVALGIVVGDTLEPYEFLGKPCATAKESKKDAAAQAVKVLIQRRADQPLPTVDKQPENAKTDIKESVGGVHKPSHCPILRIEPAALFVDHNSRVGGLRAPAAP